MNLTNGTERDAEHSSHGETLIQKIKTKKKKS